MEVKLVKYPTEEDWMFTKEMTLGTIGKHAVNPPTSEWKHKMLEARHSPIRTLWFCFELIDIPYWVSVHLTRHHEGVVPFVQTQRNDRQDNYDRGAARQDAPIHMYYYVNAEALQVIANKRLCKQASEETQEVVGKMCDLALTACPEMYDLLVPACVRQGGVCHEMYPCS